jgi:hypothetical protein
MLREEMLDKKRSMHLKKHVKFGSNEGIAVKV